MWSTSEEEKNEICRAVGALERPRVLEIGAFKGETTRALAETAAERGGYVVVLDPMRWAAEVTANGVVRHLGRRAPNIASAVESLLGNASYEPAFWDSVGELSTHVRLQRSLSTARDLIASDAPDLREFDVVFIDGDHSYEGAAADLANWGRRTALGGTIFVHDAVDRFPGVMRALREFGELEGMPVEYPSVGSLAAIRVLQAFARGGAAQLGHHVAVQREERDDERRARTSADESRSLRSPRS